MGVSESTELVEDFLGDKAGAVDCGVVDFGYVDEVENWKDKSVLCSGYLSRIWRTCVGILERVRRSVEGAVDHGQDVVVEVPSAVE